LYMLCSVWQDGGKCLKNNVFAVRVLFTLLYPSGWR
jgi:hypothetical protein